MRVIPDMQAFAETRNLFATRAPLQLVKDADTGFMRLPTEGDRLTVNGFEVEVVACEPCYTSDPVQMAKWTARLIPGTERA